MRCVHGAAMRCVRGAALLCRFALSTAPGVAAALTAVMDREMIPACYGGAMSGAYISARNAADTSQLCVPGRLLPVAALLLGQTAGAE